MPRFRQTEELEEEKIDISPLIDCVFILLIFFIVTTKFIDETGFSVEKAQAADGSSSDEESTTVILTVTNSGQIEHEGKILPLASVRTLVSAAVTKDEDVPVIVRTQGKTRAVHYVKVIDAAYASGAKAVTADIER
ncbi:MAG: biopolymer transporter ExbD [Verrucomicrobiota bacterium]